MEKEDLEPSSAQDVFNKRRKPFTLVRINYDAGHCLEEMFEASNSLHELDFQVSALEVASTLQLEMEINPPSPHKFIGIESVRSYVAKQRTYYSDRFPHEESQVEYQFRVLSYGK